MLRKKQLQDHVFGTYVSLRRGLVVIGAVFPILLYGVGAFHGVELQGSMSAYYWAPDGVVSPVRSWFVGCLFAVAACLYLYKGFTSEENVALNLAGLFAVGIALVPMEWNCKVDCGRFSVHGLCGVLMFACLAFVIWFCSRETLRLLPEARAAVYRRRYGIVGLVMLASPLAAFVMNGFTGGKSYIFFVETAGIWAFAAFWWIKLKELQESNATRRALRGESFRPTADGAAAAAPRTPPPEPEVAG